MAKENREKNFFEKKKSPKIKIEITFFKFQFNINIYSSIKGSFQETLLYFFLLLIE